MSFALPSVKPKPELNAAPGLKSEDNYSLPNTILNGLGTNNVSPTNVHPLMHSEESYHKRQQNLNMVILRNTQGLHAPLRLGMELKAAQKIGHLPFLASSNVMLDCLTGRDIELGAEDIFGLPEFRECLGQPHAIVERSLGLL